MRGTRQRVWTPADQFPPKRIKDALQKHANISKHESAQLVQAKTSKIGLRAFLFSCKGPRRVHTTLSLRALDSIVRAAVVPGGRCCASSFGGAIGAPPIFDGAGCSHAAVANQYGGHHASLDPGAAPATRVAAGRGERGRDAAGR